MGIFVGLLFGLGLLLVVTSGRQRAARDPYAASWRRSTRELLIQAGVPGVSPDQLVLISIGVSLVVGLVVLAFTATWSLAAAFSAFAAMLPRTMLLRRRHARMHDLRELWPDVVDNLASAVRAGMSLPEALASVGNRGPAPLRPAFTRFGEDYSATGSFSDSLDRLAETLADPIADRIVESLRLTREVGGTDLGRLLRTLSTFLREDARTRAELETRQGWTVNAARLALAAPWVVLLLLATRGETIRAYDSPTGVAVLGVGAVVSVLAYLLMKRIGRLPEEQRVLRPPAAAPSPGHRTGTRTGTARVENAGSGRTPTTGVDKP